MTHASDIRGIFERVLRLDLSLAEARLLLGPSWTFERSEEDFELRGDNLQIEPVLVDIDDVVRAMDYVLTGRVSAGALQQWANLLLLSDSYEIADSLSLAQSKTVVEVLHRLASPSLYGALTSDRLLSLRGRLSAN
jgi:hypothetical protein